MDEFPPAYFLPDGSTGQVVRWIPGSENGGAGSMWGGFCGANDGGFRNSQLKKLPTDIGKEKTGPPNEALQELRSPKEKKNRGKDGKTTTTTEYDSTFTRAVMKMEFDWKGAPLVPNKANDWGLRVNPCWPSYIAPEDPGYVLLTDDNWYKTAANAKDLAKQPKSLYAQPPSRSLLDEGNSAWAAANPGKGNVPIPLPEHHDRYPDEEEDETFIDRRRRTVQLLDDGYGLQEFNTSRRLTPEEIHRHIEVLPCADRSCSAEHQVYAGAHNILIIEGAPIPIPSLPATNLDTVPTTIPEGLTWVERPHSTTVVTLNTPVTTITP